MQSSKKKEKLLKLGSRREKFGGIFVKKLLPMLAAGALLCMSGAEGVRLLLVSIQQEVHFSEFSQQMNELNKKAVSDQDYIGYIEAYLYSHSEEMDGSGTVFSLSKDGKEIARTEKCAIALTGAGSKGKPYRMYKCAPSCFDPAVDKILTYSGNDSRKMSSNGYYREAGRFGYIDLYSYETKSIYINDETGMFYPKTVDIIHYRSGGRYGSAPTEEVLEVMELAPADLSGYTVCDQHDLQYAMVGGVDADSILFNRLNEQRIQDDDIHYITTEDRFCEAVSWCSDTVYTADGAYTVKAIYVNNVRSIFDTAVFIAASAVLVLCLVISLIRAILTYNVYKAHYAMEDYRRDMTNTLAHDLKTPLMAISGCAEMLNENAETEKQKHYSDMILSNVRYMDGMISNVLELSKLESGTALRKESIDIAQTARETAEKYKELLSERALNTKISGSGSINADRQLMTQVMDNLISNAAKYASKCSDIEITASEDGFTVKNRYDGTINKTADELWQPFVKGDSARSGQNGSGLGLYIVRSICDRHGIAYSLTAENGVFTVTIDK